MNRSDNKSEYLLVDGINIQVIRKDIRSLRFVVRPPTGEVRVSAPKFVDDEYLRLAVMSRIAWIRKQQKTIAELPRPPVLTYISGETHYVFGEPCRLEVKESISKPNLTMLDKNNIIMSVRVHASISAKEKLFDEWYRSELKKRIPTIVTEWEPIVGRKVAEWGVKKMKTRWGSCNINQRRIWLSLALAKKSELCLEYVVVHEMTHLIERYHNQHFHGLMDKFYPDWRDVKKILEDQTIYT